MVEHGNRVDRRHYADSIFAGTPSACRLKPGHRILVRARLDFLMMPALIGAVILVVIAAAYNNLSRHRSYPKYW